MFVCFCFEWEQFTVRLLQLLFYKLDLLLHSIIYAEVLSRKLRQLSAYSQEFVRVSIQSFDYVGKFYRIFRIGKRMEPFLLHKIWIRCNA